jgi:hypothetical protein
MKWKAVKLLLRKTPWRSALPIRLSFFMTFSEQFCLFPKDAHERGSSAQSLEIACIWRHLGRR